MKTHKMSNTLISSDVCNVYNEVNQIIKYIEDSNGILDENDEFEFKVILNELISNAIKHGNKFDCSKKVKITTGIAKNDYVYFTVEDEGPGHDYLYLMQKNKAIEDTHDICDMKETGRGVLIVKNLCDNMKFNLKGNKVVVLKRLHKV